MDNQPVIRGDEVRHGTTIYLDALSTETIDGLSEARLSDAMLYHLHDGLAPLFPVSAKQVAQRVKSAGGMVFAIHLRTDKMCIGVCTLSDVRWQARLAKLSISLLDETHLTVDMLVDVIQTVLQFAYWEANLNRIYVESIEDQTILHEAIERVGFKREGRLRQETYRNGRYLDIFIHSILQREWIESQ